MIAQLKALAALLLLAALPNAARAQEARETPPAPGAPRPVRFPKPVERTLPNGLRVIVIERPGTGLVSAQALIKTGGEADRNLPGLADMTATLLTRGTTTRSAPQIAEAIEALGGSLNSGARWDASTASVTTLASSVTPAMTIFADVVRRPAFQPAEIERLRTQTLDDLSIALRDPGTLAVYAAARVVFGDSPYGHPLGGTPESVKAIKRADITAFHRTHYRPQNALLVIGGDIKAEGAFNLARRLFEDWRGGDSPPVPVRGGGQASAKAKGRVVVIDKPDAEQAAIYVARPTIARTDPAYYSGLVANSVLGSGFSSRLNQEVRIKRGLSYGAGSSLGARRWAGLFVAESQSKNESAGEVAALLLSELGRLATEPIPGTEMTPRKATLTGSFARGLETTGGLVGQAASLALYGLNLNEINRFIPGVETVTAGDVQNFSRMHLGAEGANVVVVGNARLFLDDLRRRFPGLEVIPVAQLDLNRADLRRTGAKTLKKTAR